MAISVVVSGRHRLISRAVWTRMLGPQPYAGFECDGCSFFFDYFLGVPLWIACVYHDYPYRNPAEASRGMADFWVYRNLFYLLDLFLPVHNRWARNVWARRAVSFAVAGFCGTMLNLFGGANGWWRYTKFALVSAFVLLVAWSLLRGVLP